jgi:hypothetical protein
MRRRIGTTTIIAATAAAALWLMSADATMQQQRAGTGQNAPTPHTADGKVDLSGVWIAGAGGGGGGDLKPDEQGNLTVLSRGRPCHPGQECKPAINFERDSGVRQRMSPNLPVYKAEHWEKVQDLDVNGNYKDPEIKCYPAGLPRVGAPNKIVQTPNEIIFLYQHHNTFRVIPTDGRQHDPIRSQDLTYYGDSVGKWEGDTLVIDSIGFTDESWLAWPGYFHTNNMRVVERLRREGNTLIWQATIHDPDVLVQPWDVNPVRRNLNPNPKALLTEDLPCEDRDSEHITSRERG